MDTAVVNVVDRSRAEPLNSLSDGSDDMVFSGPQQGHGRFPTEPR